MKTFLSITLLLVLSFAAFGQSRKPPAPSPSPKISSEIKAEAKEFPKEVPPDANQKVVILKTNGDKISGLFVGGDTEKITVNFSNSTINVKLSEIQSLNFNDALTTAPSNPEPITTPTPTPNNQVANNQNPFASVDFNANPKTSATIEDATLFPGNYANRFVDFKGVWIGKIEPQQIAGDLVYSLWVESPRGQTSTTVVTTGKVNFILAPEMAKALSDYYAAKRRNEYTKMGVNLTVGFANIEQGFSFAFVKCIEFLSYQGKGLATIGVCN